MQLRMRTAIATIATGIVLAAHVAAAQNRRFEQTHTETQTLAIGAAGWLELRNLVGDVLVTAGTGREVRLEIVRRSRGVTEADAKIGLERVRVEVDKQGDRAVVTARYPEEQRPRYGVSVGYNVTAPPGTRVGISTTSGDVIVRDIKGDVSVQVTSGDITVSGAALVSSLRTISGDVTLTDTSTDAVITVGTMSGDILMERVKARRVAADVTSGDVHLRQGSVESAQLKSLSGDVEYAGPLTRGGRYELQTHSGTVLFNVTGDIGFSLQANTFNGAISLPPSGLDLRNVTTARRSLRGTVGDGSAVVSLTTFSGDIRVNMPRR